jgi:hypothetical protein
MKFKEGFWAGGITLTVVSVCIVVKAMKLDGITKEVSIQRKDQEMRPRKL